MPIDDSALPYPKRDRIPVPANEDTREYVSSNDWNTLCTVVDSIRENGGGGGGESAHSNAAALRASSDHLTLTTARIAGRGTAGDGGGGFFVWESGETSADDGAVFLKPSSVSGAGRWVREGWKEKVILPQWFGAVADWTDYTDPSTDNYAAFRAMLDFIKDHATEDFVYSVGGRHVYIPPGLYRISQKLVIDTQVLIEGGGGYWNCQLIFQNSNGSAGTPIDGIVFAAGDPGFPSSFGSRFSVCRGIAVLGDGHAYGIASAESQRPNENDPLTNAATQGHANTPGNGFVIQQDVAIENCIALGFKRDGFHVEAIEDADNANTFRLSRCISNSNGRHGFFFVGENANAGNCDNLDANGNASWGIYDRSFLGNSYQGGQIANNGYNVADITALMPDWFEGTKNLWVGSTEGSVFYGLKIADYPNHEWRTNNTGLQDVDGASPDSNARIVCLERSLAASDNRMLAGGPDGLFRMASPVTTKSAHGGWIRVNSSDGLTESDVRSIAYKGTSGTTLYVGTASGVFKSTDNGNTWTATNSGLTNTDVRAVVVDVDVTTTVYAATYGGKVFKSTDSGATWNVAGSGTFSSTNVLCLDAQAGAILAGCSDGKVYKSLDSGATWSLILTASGGSQINALSHYYYNGNKLLAATGGAGVYVSTNLGSSWTQRAGADGLQSEATAADLLDIRSCCWDFEGNPFVGVKGTGGYHPSGSGGGVFFSADGGTTWGPANQSLRYGGGVRVTSAVGYSFFGGTYVESDQNNYIRYPTVVCGGVLAGAISGSSSDAIILGPSGLRNAPVYSALIYSPRTVTASSTSSLFSATADDRTVLMDCSAHNGILVLPAASTMIGQEMTIIRTDVQYASYTASVQSLVGAVSAYYLQKQYDFVIVRALAHGWEVVSSGTPTLLAYATADLPDASVAGDGTAVFDTTTETLKIASGGSWVEVGAGGGSPAQADITDLRTTGSAVDLAVAGATVTADVGSYTYGELIMPMRAGLTMTGVRFYWPGGFGAKNVKVSLWNAGGSRVDSATVVVNAAGAYTGLFASPQALTAYTDYRISTWEDSGGHATMITGANVSAFTGAVITVSNGFNGKHFWPGYVRYQGFYAAGDTYPSTGDSTDLTGVLEPIFQ